MDLVENSKMESINSDINKILNKYQPLSENETLSSYMYRLWKINCGVYADLDDKIETLSHFSSNELSIRKDIDRIMSSYMVNELDCINMKYDYYN